MRDRVDPSEPDPAADARRWGLCATCRHHVTIANDRGSRFVQCARARTDSRFPRYPRVPVRECRGHEAAEETSPTRPRER